MQLGDALNDLREIAKLPGTILLLRGNHDYWWSSLSQLRACLPENMHAVQNDAFDAGECVFCGTRGWTIPLGQNAAAQDEKLYRREALRLEMSLKDAARIANGRPIFAMMHYPPLLPETAASGDGVHAVAERIRGQALCLRPSARAERSARLQRVIPRGAIRSGFLRRAGLCAQGCVAGGGGKLKR